MTFPDDMQAALDEVGARIDGGGGGVALLAVEHGETVTLLTDRGGLPRSLDAGPIDAGLYDSETWEPVADQQQHPTLAHALLDLYGPVAGAPLPAGLVACNDTVRRWQAGQHPRQEVAR